jgi:hypothetical protein
MNSETRSYLVNIPFANSRDQLLDLKSESENILRALIHIEVTDLVYLAYFNVGKLRVKFSALYP